MTTWVVGNASSTALTTRAAFASVISSARRHVPLPVRAVATDVDPPHAWVVVVAAAELVHQPFPAGEECLAVPVGDVRAGLQRHERGCGVVEPAAGAVRQHPEAEPSAVLLRILETAVEPREVVAPGGRLDASPRDLVPVVHIGDRPASGLCCTAEPGVLATQGVRHLRGRHRNGPRAERRRRLPLFLPFALALVRSPIGGAGALTSAAMASASASAGTTWSGNASGTTFERCGGSTGGSPLRCVSDSREGHGSLGFRGKPWANGRRIVRPGHARLVHSKGRGPADHAIPAARPPQGSDRAEGRRVIGVRLGSSTAPCRPAARPAPILPPTHPDLRGCTAVSKPVVLIAEELSPATVDALGPDFEIRTCNGADRAELLAGHRRRRRDPGPLGHQGRRRGAGRGQAAQGGRPRRGRPRQRRREGRHPVRA